MIVCLGPCCFPLWQLLPVLLAFLHQRGFLTFVKKEWVTMRYWGERLGLMKPKPKVVIGIPNEEEHDACCKDGVCALKPKEKAPPPAPADVKKAA